MTFEQIFRQVGISNRASYYSGRGATMSDLTGEHLSKIHVLIEKHHGKEAATGFVDMVEDMPNMNATDFINNCYRLEGNDYKWQKSTATKSGFDIDKDASGNHNEAQGMATIAAFMGGGSRTDQTMQIKGGFLRSHGRRCEPIGDYANGRYYREIFGY